MDWDRKDPSLEIGLPHVRLQRCRLYFYCVAIVYCCFYGWGRFPDLADTNPTSNWVFLTYSLKVGSIRSTMRNKAGHSIKP